MRKLNFFKTLLVAVGLCAGVNAWADATIIYGRAITADTENGYSAWSSSDVASSGTDNYVWYGNFSFNETYGLYSYANGSRQAVMTFAHTENSIQTIDIVFDNLGNTGDGGNYSYIKIGSDIEIQSNQQNQWGHVIINGNTTNISDCNQKNYNRGGDKWTIHAEINTAKKILTALTIVGTKMNGKSASYTLASETNLSGTATFNSVTIGFVRAKGNPSAAMTSIKIAEEAQAVETADYTINYKLGDVVVKSVSSSSTVGLTITAAVAVDGEGDYVDKHYLITAAEAPTMTLTSGTNVLNVPVRAPYTATLNVTTTIGTGEPSLVTTNLVESDTKSCAWSYAYPLYAKNGDVYYKADETATFGEGDTFTDGQVINKSVTYSTADESIIFYAEAEAAAGTNYAYSNGNTGVVGAQNARDRGIYVGTLPAGIYEFITNITAANRRSLGIRQSTNDFIASVGTSNEDMTTGIKSQVFTLDSETSSLYINGANSGDAKTNQSEDFDYVLIKKLPASVSKTITAAGYATYCSPYALDFSKVSGLTAYRATLSAGPKVTFTAVTEVPAGEGVLLKGDEGEYTIPVIANAAAIENVLVGVTEAGQTASAGSFVLMAPTSKPVGFYKTTSVFNLTANSAYIPAISGARDFIGFDFDETETTGINEVKNVKANNAIYNLKGMKVKTAQKGLYIINGKKVVK